jgi:hypothetical protein
MFSITDAIGNSWNCADLRKNYKTWNEVSKQDDEGLLRPSGSGGENREIMKPQSL